MKDYYAILGIKFNATAQDITKTYRQLAMKYHPDRNKDTLAESIFKEINEAYETLSNPVTKSKYDQLYVPTIIPKSKRKKATSQVFIIQITLDDAYKGCKVTTEYGDIVIHPGVRNGTRYELCGRIFEITITPHDIFIRDHDDLHATVELTVVEALIGLKCNIQHLNNNSYTIEIPPGIQHGQIIKIERFGMPSQLLDKPGNLLLKCALTVQSNLSVTQIETLRTIFNPRASINI